MTDSKREALHRSPPLEVHSHMSTHLSLLQINEAIDRDFAMLFDESNLVGQVAENIDIKEILRLAINIQKASDGGENWLARQMVEAIPDATNAKQRRDNVIRVARIAFDFTYRRRLQQGITSKLAEVKAKQEKIAAKQKAKQEAKKSKKR